MVVAGLGDPDGEGLGEVLGEGDGVVEVVAASGVGEGSGKDPANLALITNL